MQELSLRKNVDEIGFKVAAMMFENALTKLPQTEIETANYFSDGTYVRVTKLPKEHCITGGVHKKDHICVVIGHVVVIDESGENTYNGVHVFNSPAGVKRVLRTIDNTLFMTIHGTDLKDIAAIEDELFSDSYASYDEAMK